MISMSKERESGFTIIELMFVLVIISILLALAYPSYVDYVRKSKRGEAQQLLMNWSVNQEIWRSNNPEYATELQLPVPTHDDYEFEITMPEPPLPAFILQAVAQGDQANDKAKDGTACTTLNLRSDGRKYSGGLDAVSICWE